jgi:superfamily II DNA helicase RecQ
MATVKAAINEVSTSLGYHVLKPLQHEVISSILIGNDIFAILPTGYSKTIISPPYIFDIVSQVHSQGNDEGIILVVSPLKALLEDQVSEHC